MDDRDAKESHEDWSYFHGTNTPREMSPLRKSGSVRYTGFPVHTSFSGLDGISAISSHGSRKSCGSIRLQRFYGQAVHLQHRTPHEKAWAARGAQGNLAGV